MLGTAVAINIDLLFVYDNNYSMTQMNVSIVTEYVEEISDAEHCEWWAGNDVKNGVVRASGLPGVYLRNKDDAPLYYSVEAGGWVFI